MKKSLVRLVAVAAVVLAFSPAVSWAGDAWSENYTESLAKAASEKRPVLMEFTGSDWCPPCKMLDEKTLSKPAFLDFAAEKLVLVKLDYPNAKPQSDEVKKQNAELAAKYGIEGYPTLVLLSADGTELERHVGFLPGGPDALISWVNNAAKN